MNPGYDNYIAPGSYNQKTGPSKKTVTLIGGLVLALLISLVLIVLGNTGPNTTELGQRLQARLFNLQTLTEQASENLTNDELIALNAETKVVLASDLASLNAAFGFGDSEPPEEIIAEEADQVTLDSLAEAKLQGNYDQEFRQVLSQKLESSNALINEIYQETNDEQLRLTLDEVYIHFSDLQDRLAVQ